MKPNAPVVYKDFKTDEKSYLFKFYNETTFTPRGNFVMFNAFVNIEHGEILINIRCVSDSSEYFPFEPYDYTQFIRENVTNRTESLSYETVATMIKAYIINHIQTSVIL